MDKLKKKRFNSQWYNSYIKCYCYKESQIQLGWKLYGLMNIALGIPLFVAAIAFALFTILSGDIINTLFLVIVLIIFVSLYILGYASVMSEMKRDGHTTKCVRKVSLIGSFFYGTYSEFKIFNKEK